MAAIRPEELGTILSIWAHPDDETYLAGGVMAAAAAHGQRVVCATASAGERGTDDPMTWPPERLGGCGGGRRRPPWRCSGSRSTTTSASPTAPSPTTAARGGHASGGSSTRCGPTPSSPSDPTDGRSTPTTSRCTTGSPTAWVARGCGPRLLYAAVTNDLLDRFLGLEEDLGVYMSDERPLGVHPADLAVHLRVAGPLLDQKLTALRAMATQTSGAMATIPAATFAAIVAEEAFVAALRPVVTVAPRGPRRWPGEPPGTNGVMALLRRALVALGLAALVAAVLRLRGSGGTPPQDGGWRELSGPDLQ